MFRVYIYSNDLVLPLVVPLRCETQNLTDRLQRIFAHDLNASRAEVWNTSTMILQIDAGGIAAFAALAATDDEPPAVSTTLH